MGKSQTGIARRLRERLVVGLALTLARAVPMLSLEWAQRLGAGLGALVGAVPSKRRRRVVGQLVLAWPDQTPAFRKRLLRETYRAMGMTVLEALWVSAWKPWDDRRVRVANEERLAALVDQARQEQRGLIIYTAHLGNPEILGSWIIRHLPMQVMAVASRPKIEGLVQPMIRQRESGGLKLVFRGEAGTATMRHLKAGGALVMLVDHNLKGEGFAVPFFGRPAHTLLAPARLALQSGALAATMVVVREGPGRFVLHVDEPLILPEFSRDPEARLTQQAHVVLDYTNRIEQAIRNHPEQYLWMHRRWQERSETLPLPFPWPPCSPSSLPERVGPQS